MITKTVKRKTSFKENFGGAVFILPWIIGFLVFTLIPFVCLIAFSFTKYDMLSAPKFIGLKNYINIFANDTKFLSALKVTFTFVIVSVPLKLAVALLVALALNTKHKFIGIYRTAFYIPSIIGGSIAVAITWSKIFARDGAFNAIIEKVFGINPNISWVGDPKTALASLILLAVWQFGSPMLIFLAGLKNIPISYYEAAEVDGAGPVRRFFKITLPLLSPIIFFNLVMQIISGFMNFTQGLVITNGGPLDKTLFYQLYVYRQGFEQFNMGYASALSCILLVIITCFASLIFKSSSGWVFYESKEQ
jgi:multiple sugar transport system permease protein